MIDFKTEREALEKLVDIAIREIEATWSTPTDTIAMIRSAKATQAELLVARRELESHAGNFPLDDREHINAVIHRITEFVAACGDQIRLARRTLKKEKGI